MTDLARTPLTLLRLAAVGGLIWNAFGLYQFCTTTFSTAEQLIDMGMTQAQAQLYVSLPLWMHIAFAIGTTGGLLGSLLLCLRRRSAQIAFVASLLGYIILYVGDWALGVFAAFGASQVMVLSVVLAIAVLLWWSARRWITRGLLN